MATTGLQLPSDSLEDPLPDEESQQQDWQIPLTFMRARHVLQGEEREASVVNSDSWRVKDRVSFSTKPQLTISVVVIWYR